MANNEHLVNFTPAEISLFIKSLFCSKISPKQDSRRKAREPFPAAYIQLFLVRYAV